MRYVMAQKSDEVRKKCVRSGLWHEDCKFIIGSQQKQRFLHYSIRYGAENAVFAS